MKEQLIEFNTAVLAKEKGFNEETLKGYTHEGKLDDPYYGNVFKNLDNSNNLSYSAPTQSLLAKWLREVHNIQVESKLNSKLYKSLFEKAQNKKCLNYSWTIITNINDPDFIFEEFYSKTSYDTYEKALEVGLFEALKLIK